MIADTWAHIPPSSERDHFLHAQLTIGKSGVGVAVDRKPLSLGGTSHHACVNAECQTAASYRDAVASSLACGCGGKRANRDASNRAEAA